MSEDAPAAQELEKAHHWFAVECNNRAWKLAEQMSQKIGPDYVKLMSALEQVDNSDKEVQQLTAPIDALAQQCPR